MLGWGIYIVTYRGGNDSATHCLRLKNVSHQIPMLRITPASNGPMEVGGSCIELDTYLLLLAISKYVQIVDLQEVSDRFLNSIIIAPAIASRSTPLEAMFRCRPDQFCKPVGPNRHLRQLQISIITQA